MKELSVEEQIYLCKYHDVDTSLNLTLGINQKEAELMLNKLKANGMYEQYRKLDEDQYEDIIKSEKRKDKFDKVLDKYNFERDSILKDLLKVADKAKNEKDLKLKDVISQVATQRKTTVSSVENETNRELIKIYNENKILFKQNGYKDKPSLKEFLVKELKMTDRQNQQSKQNIYESKEILCEDKEKINTDNKSIDTEINETTAIKVPLIRIYEYYYLKGFVDGIKRK